VEGLKIWGNKKKTRLEVHKKFCYCIFLQKTLVVQKFKGVRAHLPLRSDGLAATPMPLVVIMCTRFLHGNLCKLFDLQRVSIFFPAKGRPMDQSRKAKERKWCQLINLKPILALLIYN
jgi:hypothetical protein